MLMISSYVVFARKILSLLAQFEPFPHHSKQNLCRVFFN